MDYYSDRKWQKFQPGQCAPCESTEFVPASLVSSTDTAPHRWQSDSIDGECLDCGLQPADHPKVRTFETGATRDTDENKPDYEGYLSPFVLERFGQYMLKHQYQSDGTKRASDNWQKGIPVHQYLKSLVRHVIELWRESRRTYDGMIIPNYEDTLCAIMFNAMGMLHELLKARRDAGR